MSSNTRQSINAKGEITIENVVSVIIVVIILVAFIFGAYKIYTVYRNQESENAQTMANNLEGKVNALEYGQTGSFLIQGFENSNSWDIVSWDAGDPTGPDKCNYQSCICVCKSSTGRASNSDKSVILSAPCQSNGFCRTFTVSKISVKYNTKAYTDSGTSDSGSTSAVSHAAGVYPFIPLPKTTNEIKITKEKDKVSLEADCNIAPNLCLAWGY
jgi:hypothetical protein